MRSPLGHAANAASSFANMSLVSKSPLTATITLLALNTRAANAAMSLLVMARIVASVGSRASKWFSPYSAMSHSRPRIGSASSLRCFICSSMSSTAIFCFASSKRGLRIMSIMSERLSSKFALRQSIDAPQMVARAPIEISVARKSSRSSSSVGARLSVPPERIKSAVIPASPTLSADSR